MDEIVCVCVSARAPALSVCVRACVRARACVRTCARARVCVCLCARARVCAYLRVQCSVKENVFNESAFMEMILLLF